MQTSSPDAAPRPSSTTHAPEEPMLLQVTGLAKRYGNEVVFRHVELQARAGEFVAILGASGVGKSTLLNAIAGLDTVDEGEVLLDGRNVLALSDTQQAKVRRTRLGFVFQAFHVLPHLTVGQNVALPLLLLRGEAGPSGAPSRAVRDEESDSRNRRVAQVLAAVGLEGLQSRLPAQLSGGQLQRVAIARAVVHRPRLVLADEPTGNLDPATAERVLDTLAGEVRREGTACLLVTHSTAAASRADRVLELRADGLFPYALR